MTITELILNFRDGLNAVLPMLERVNVPWKAGVAYDEWDKIAGALFEALVVDPLRYGLGLSDPDGFRLAPYDLLLPDYSEYSVIEVASASLDAPLWPLHSLRGGYSGFDSVQLRMIGPDGLPIEREYTEVPIEDATFILRLNEGSFPGRAIKSVEIQH